MLNSNASPYRLCRRVRTLEIPIPELLLLPARRQAGTLVIIAESKHAVGAKRGNPDRAALRSFLDSMFDRVFCHGLQNQAGNLSEQELPGDAHAELQAFSKSHLLNVQIPFCKLQFLSQ